MKDRFPVIVVGAGPAGIAAATTVAGFGIEVALIDEQQSPGGQIYRHVEHSSLATEVSGREYPQGKSQVRALRDSDVSYFPETGVWNLEADGTVGLLHNGVSRCLRPDRVILAVGARERPMPVRGWQLPGVMTAGAGQILLKTANAVPGDGVVLAGSGPLLLLLACQYLRAGVRIGALLDTTPRVNWRQAAASLPGALAAGEYLLKGARMMREIRRARVPFYRDVEGLCIAGEEAVEGVRFSSRGRQQELRCSLVLLHQGVVPALELPVLAGCGVSWSEPQQCWLVPVDEWGQTTHEAIRVVGDGAAINGAVCAALAGQLTGFQVAHEMGRIDTATRDRLARPVRRSLRRQSAVRPFLEKLYRVADEYLAPADDVLVCRCEEVSAGEIRQLVRDGCPGPNQLKAFSRCGMGPCQGRFCGPTVEQIFAHETASSVAGVGRFRVRPPARPITLGAFAPGDQSG